MTDYDPKAGDGHQPFLSRQHPLFLRLQQGFTGLASFALTLLGLLVFTFLLSRAAPIDPALQLVGDHASEATYQQARG